MKPGPFGPKHVASVLWTEYWFTVICSCVCRGFIQSTIGRDTLRPFYIPRTVQLVITFREIQESEPHGIVSSWANFNTTQRKDISCIRYVSRCFWKQKGDLQGLVHVVCGSDAQAVKGSGARLQFPQASSHPAAADVATSAFHRLCWQCL